MEGEAREEVGPAVAAGMCFRRRIWAGECVASLPQESSRGSNDSTEIIGQKGLCDAIASETLQYTEDGDCGQIYWILNYYV